VTPKVSALQYKRYVNMNFQKLSIAPQCVPKRAQGLPISFIVLIALGVFVLLLVMLFFLSGSQQASGVSQQAAYNACNSRCSAAIQYAQSGGTYPQTGSSFCSVSYNVPGLGAKQCDALISCKVNDTCILTCELTKAKCT